MVKNAIDKLTARSTMVSRPTLCKVTGPGVNHFYKVVTVGMSNDVPGAALRVEQQEQFMIFNDKSGLVYSPVPLTVEQLVIVFYSGNSWVAVSAEPTDLYCAASEGGTDLHRVYQAFDASGVTHMAVADEPTEFLTAGHFVESPAGAINMASDGSGGSYQANSAPVLYLYTSGGLLGLPRRMVTNMYSIATGPDKGLWQESIRSSPGSPLYTTHKTKLVTYGSCT